MIAPRKAVRFRERSELLDFLLEVSTVTSQTLDLDELLANVSEIVKRVIPGELFAILLYSEKRRELRIRYALGHREEVVQNWSIPLGEGITGTAALTREPVLAADVRSDPRYLNAVEAVRTELAVPMIARRKLVGVIDVQSTRPNAYTEQDRALLRLIAARVAISIDNARLYWRVERQNRTLKALASISQEFSSILDVSELLNKIASTVRGLINYDAFNILLVDAERQLLRHRFSMRYDQRVDLDNVPLGKGITGAAVEQRAPVRVDDTMQDPRYIASHPGIRSEVAIPLMTLDRVSGVMDLESERVGFFTDEHIRMLNLLAPQIAASVENARLYEELAIRERRMEEDMQAARELQRVLLPTGDPGLEGLEVAAGLRPARGISGDIYDFFESQDHRAVLAFGDVSGKGAAAALYGALVSGLLRTLAPRRTDPRQLMRALNEALIERKVEARFVTLLLMLWSPAIRQFVMANAGGNPPLVCRNREILKPRVEGVPLGLLDEREYEEVVFQAHHGDTIVLYSDGVTDHLSPDGLDYGRHRLSQVVRRVCDHSPEAIVAEILADLDQFNTTPFDDQTLLVMKVK
ncbi:MAG TPA: SpoIIE family protein phosphatase [Bryobacteraceae bacterium]|jgi:sigma-B regulation protein RsbU (phosphoserine phosphatase)|nr:SpoIIE family protein phosphatase [Bryobacteraceae bacterium]